VPHARTGIVAKQRLDGLGITGRVAPGGEAIERFDATLTHVGILLQ
jgi:hypothetical protein